MNTTAICTVVVGDIIFPESWATAVYACDLETVVYIMYCGNISKLMFQDVRLLTEKLFNEPSGLKYTDNEFRAKYFCANIYV